MFIAPGGRFRIPEIGYCASRRLVKSITAIQRLYWTILAGLAIICSMVDQTWFTREEAAEYLRVGTRTLDRWIADGKLRAFKKSSRLVRLKREDLDSFMLSEGEEAGR